MPEGDRDGAGIHWPAKEATPADVIILRSPEWKDTSAREESVLNYRLFQTIANVSFYSSSSYSSFRL